MELIAQRSPSKRLNTNVWYYNKELDSPEILAALKEVGLNVINKVAQRNQASDPTNAVWYGPEANFNDFKAVLVSLHRYKANRAILQRFRQQGGSYRSRF